MRMNLLIDENLRDAAKHKAISMGLNLSSYIRFLLSKDTEEFRNKIDAIAVEAEKDKGGTMSYQDFITELDGYIANAKN